MKHCFQMAWLASALLLAVTTIVHAQPSRSDPEPATAEAVKKQVRAKEFMVTAANPLAVQAGYDVLKEGGSAVDAVIAVQMVLNLVEPQSSGIGGGAFILHFDANSGELTSYDGRDTAPAAATPDLFLDGEGNFVGMRNVFSGGRSTGVPGLVRLAERVHEDHGKLDWARLFAPAIELSRQGFAVSPRLASMLKGMGRSLARNADTSAYFFAGGDIPVGEGEILKNAALADAFAVIAEQGADAFYQGDIATSIVERVSRAVAESPYPDYEALTLEDFARYEVIERDPICGTYRDYKVCGMGPPSSGGVAVLQILGMLDSFELASDPDARSVHLVAEAQRRAYADRALYLADPAQVKVPVQALIDPAYLAARASTIDPTLVAAPVVDAGVPNGMDLFPYAPAPRGRRGRSTSHLSVIDADGNAVTMTTSIETAFGSRLMAHGFILNNQLTDFSYYPTNNGKPVANAPGPGKRPLSSMSPTIIFEPDGSLYMLIGSPGGTRIIAYVAKTIVAHIDWQLNVQDAIAFPHIINQNGITALEEKQPVLGFVESLEAMGHEVRLQNMSSGLHGIVVSGKRLLGGADPRREGIAMGD